MVKIYRSSSNKISFAGYSGSLDTNRFKPKKQINTILKVYFLFIILDLGISHSIESTYKIHFTLTKTLHIVLKIKEAKTLRFYSTVKTER